MDLIPHSRPWLGPAERQAASDVLMSGMLLGGGKANEFKNKLAPILDATPFLFSSGRQSIFAGLRALNLPPKSEVVVQTYVCSAVDEAIRAAHLIPRYCDVGDRWFASEESVGAVFDSKCSAIVLASPFGFVQTAESFRKFGVPILNDLCQAAPDVLSKRSGIDFGDVAALSFHPTKYLCAGSGAAVDLSGRYSNSLGKLEQKCLERYPLYETQIAIGIAQLSRLEELSSRRRSISAKYASAVPRSRIGWLSNLSTMQSGRLLRFPLWSEGKDLRKLFDAFRKRGVIVRSGVDSLAHRGQGIADNSFPFAVDALHNTISVPFYPALSDDQVGIVSESLELLS